MSELNAGASSWGERIIYLIVIGVLVIPIWLGLSLPAVLLPNSTKAFNQIEQVAKLPAPIALVSLDFGPGTKAESEQQAVLLIEHLFLRKIPFVLMSLVPIAEPFLESLPQRAIQQIAAQGKPLPQYGTDWVNVGYKPGQMLFVEGLRSSGQVAEYLGQDSRGTPLSQLPFMQRFRTVTDLSLLVEISSLVGTTGYFISYLPKDGKLPPFVHGCTSIMVPTAYPYLKSGQLTGLLEGVAGAASYERTMNETFEGRTADDAGRINTGLSFAQLLIVVLIALGNIVMWAQRWRKSQEKI